MGCDIICPHCGYEDEGFWEIASHYIDCGDGGDTYECCGCERDFVIKVQEIDYSFECRKEPEGYEDARQRSAGFLAMHEKQLEKHYLEGPKQDHPATWLLRESSRSLMMSTAITFTPWGIVLQGDLTPSMPGNVSVGGYGIGWFSGNLSGDYLCGKFRLNSNSHDGPWLIAIQRAFAREYKKFIEAGK